jgi:hypothetical protein
VPASSRVRIKACRMGLLDSEIVVWGPK